MPAVQKRPDRSIDDFHKNRVVGGGKNQGHIDRTVIPGEGWVSETKILEELVGLSPNDVHAALLEIVSREYAEAEGLIIVGDDGVTYYEEHLAHSIIDAVYKKYPERFQASPEKAARHPVALLEDELEKNPLTFR